MSQQAIAADDSKHKLVIQVSGDDVRTQNIAMNNAVNVQKALGIDNVSIEIVAYGRGLKMLTPKSPASSRVPNLALQDITFSACGNTMAKTAKKSGKPVKLVDGVKVVQAGARRIMQLQEQGYSYVRPSTAQVLLPAGRASCFASGSPAAPALILDPRIGERVYSVCSGRINTARPIGGHYQFLMPEKSVCCMGLGFIPAQVPVYSLEVGSRFVGHRDGNLESVELLVCEHHSCQVSVFVFV